MAIPAPVRPARGGPAVRFVSGRTVFSASLPAPAAFAFLAPACHDSSADDVRWFCLELHSTYRCRHAGVCCGADWRIPAEPQVIRLVTERGLGSAVVPTRVFAHSPEDGET